VFDHNYPLQLEALVQLQQPDKRLRVRVDVNAQIRVRPSDRLVSDVEKICGAGSVSLRQ